MDTDAYVCRKCGQATEKTRLIKNKYVCPVCGAYFRVPARERISMVVDKGSFEEWDDSLESEVANNDPEYREKLNEARKKTGIREAVITGTAAVFGKKIAIGACDAYFLMGSMGYVVGEKVTRLFERATSEGLAVFLFCCSGGARMQEGLTSLMQMEKTAAAVGRHSDKGLFYCSILTDPTMGGVTASFASLGDVVIAEPGALIGFAGERVIKQTIGQELPDDFQRAEFQEKHGFIDGVVERKRLRHVMLFLAITNQKDNASITKAGKLSNPLALVAKENTARMFRAPSSAWNNIREIRKSDYPSAMDYIDHIFDTFVELKGDRYFADDKAIVGGIGILDGRAVTVISVVRGNTVEEAVRRNFGMPLPEGYRKALRLMKQAEKFHRPIITFVNTAGAYCGIGAEERGQGEAIARNLLEMSKLKVPILVLLVGEAGSGGALALSVGNEVWMMENATYSILTPEGYASILWRDSSRAEEAANRMKITAKDLKKEKIIDRIIPKFGDKAKDAVPEVSEYLKVHIIKFLVEMSKKIDREIVQERYERFRRM